jgi:hypothetical protein
LTLRDYIEYKQEEYRTIVGDDVPGWNMLRSQINSAAMLGIENERIEIFALPQLDYEKREIYKYALYEHSIEDSYIIELINENVTSEVARERIANKKINIEMTERFTGPLKVLSESINAYKSDIDNFKQQADDRLSQKQQEMEMLREQLRDKSDECELLKEEKESLIRQRKAEEEKRAQDEKIEKMANARLEQLKLEQEAENERLEYEKKKWMAENFEDNLHSKKLIFRRKKGKDGIDNGIKDANKSRKTVPEFKTRALPKDFNLESYIMTAGLSTGQLEVVSMAVKCNVDDSMIKQMIDQRLPATQMKQVLALILTRQKGNQK